LLGASLCADAQIPAYEREKPPTIQPDRGTGFPLKDPKPASGVPPGSPKPSLKDSKGLEAAPPESAEYRQTLQKRLDALFYNMRGDITFVAARSGPGEAASGVVVHRTNDSIAIDMTPCLPKKTLRYFISPYSESAISDEQCGEKKYPRVQVIQQKTR
jgi:hypothetical protein